MVGMRRDGLHGILLEVETLPHLIQLASTRFSFQLLLPGIYS